MHVFEKAVKSQIGEVYVATCDNEIALEVERNGGKCIMTDNRHTTGTDRVYEAAQKLNLQASDVIINLQGDEPMINPLDIERLCKISREKNLYISTLAFKLKNNDDYENTNVVKVITKNKLSGNSTEEALNFCRKVDLNKNNNVFHHVGIYLYKFSALKKFVNLKKSENEIKEKLEQLRILDNKMKINVILANYFSSGIDTKKDLEEYIKKIN